MREKGTRPKFSRQLRIILTVRDVRLWPPAVVRQEPVRTTANGESRRPALPRKHLLEFTLTLTNSYLPREDHRPLGVA